MHPDVAGVEPAVGVERLGRLLGLVEVAAEHVSRPGRSPRRPRRARSSRPGHRAADGAGADRERVPGHEPGRLAHAVHLAQRDAEPAEEVEDLDRDRRRPADRGDAARRARAAPAPRPGRRRPRPTPPRGRPAAPRARRVWSETFSPMSSAASSCALRAGSALAIAITPGVDLLPDARHREEDVRAHLRQVLRDLARLRARRDLVVEREPAVVRDVCARRCAPSAGTTRARAPSTSMSANASRVHLTVHVTLAWSSITPLGGPVVPEV